MTESALKEAIETAVRAAFSANSSAGTVSKATRLEQAKEYALDLIIPVAVALVEEGREEGYQLGLAADRPTILVTK